MHDKYTKLLTATAADVRTVPEDAFVLCLNDKGDVLKEYRSKQPLDPAAASLRCYTVPLAPVTARICVTDAITCTKPDGTTFKPGLCLNVRLRYISPSGLGTLLRKTGRMPDCLTIEDLYNQLSRDVRQVCADAARKLTREQTRSYQYWWQDLKYGEVYRDMIFPPLMQLFSLHGFRLEKDDFSIAGIAPMPVR